MALGADGAGGTGVAATGTSGRSAADSSLRGRDLCVARAGLAAGGLAGEGSLTVGCVAPRTPRTWGMESRATYKTPIATRAARPNIAFSIIVNRSYTSPWM